MRLTKSLRLFILERDKWVCQYCGVKATQVDHIKPQCRGGENVPANLVASCSRCNLKASGLSFKTFDAKKAFILDPTTKAPQPFTRQSTKNLNHPWKRPINSKKSPPRKP